MLICSGSALAYTEYCPADVNIHAVGVPAGQPSALYSVALSALTPRSVSGTIVVGGSEKWYAVPFDKMRLDPVALQWQDIYATFTRKQSMSNAFYLKFDAPILIDHAYLRVGTVTEERLLGWDNEEHGCPYDGKPAITGSGSSMLKLLQVPPGMDATPSPQSLVLSPHGIVVPGPTDCAKPFADASVTSAMRPDVRSDFTAANISQALAVVQVALNEDGGVDDAWIWKSTGNDQFDSAALLAAKRSRYAPKIAFCKAVPGMYVFFVNYR